MKSMISNLNFSQISVGETSQNLYIASNVKVDILRIIGVI